MNNSDKESRRQTYICTFCLKKAVDPIVLSCKHYMCYNCAELSKSTEFNRYIRHLELSRPR